MRKLRVFESVTLDGYFAGPGGDLSWAHTHGDDPEFQAFVKGNASTPGVMLFGRVTYEMMASYWPTPAAAKANPVVAKGMNAGEKVVFSRTLERVDWENTTLIKGDLLPEVRKLKKKAGRDLIVLGSGSIVSQLATAGLVDEYQLVVRPVAIGRGRSLFEGLDAPLPLRLSSSRAFPGGNVALTYVPAR